MADIATVFGWIPGMEDFTLVELMEWRERARRRSGSE
ncbi:GpE family phage tail protein [Paraburkholderia agricolaris]|uniref:GpE family phage tail protein n=1 Tax=Paraburkholderia agricolaris TaxID=2152888 RepID=A0ABW9A0E2_9BURK